MNARKTRVFARKHGAVIPRTCQGPSEPEPIGWDHFFEKFDEKGLSLVYQEATSDGHVSRFNRIIESPTT